MSKIGRVEHSLNKSLSLELETPSSYITEDALGKIYLKVPFLFYVVTLQAFNISDLILYSHRFSSNNDSQNKIFLKSSGRWWVLYKVKKHILGIKCFDMNDNIMSSTQHIQYFNWIQHEEDCSDCCHWSRNNCHQPGPSIQR